MTSVRFLIFSLLLVMQIHEFQAYELRQNQSAVHFSLYSLNSSSAMSFSDWLSRDKECVRTLNIKLTKKSRPDSVDIPVSQGLSPNPSNYLVRIGLGTPVKFYSLIIDTGSSLTWLQCKDCGAYCYHQIDPLFDQAESTTFKNLACTTPECDLLQNATGNYGACQTAVNNNCVYVADSADSSCSIGYLSQDSLSVTPSETVPDFTFGCGFDNTGTFGTAAGLIGLARNKLSLFSQISSNNFSYCLPTARGGGWYLSFGNVNPPSVPYKFTPMLDDNNTGLYFLKLIDIVVNGTSLSVPVDMYQVPTIIDSGTVIRRLPVYVYNALRYRFRSTMGTVYAMVPGVSVLDTCFNGSLNTIQAENVPEIRMVFDGAAVTLGISNILVEDDHAGVVCLAFAGNVESTYIIGNAQQQTFTVAYDVAGSRIGFALSMAAFDQLHLEINS